MSPPSHIHTHTIFDDRIKQILKTTFKITYYFYCSRNKLGFSSTMNKESKGIVTGERRNINGSKELITVILLVYTIVGSL